MALTRIEVKDWHGHLWPRLLAAVVLGLSLIGPGTGSVIAASPSVSAPTAKVVFLKGITFTGSATLTSDVARVEVVIDIEGATRSVVADVPTSATSGATNLSWVLDTPGGFVLPNTNVTARFRITLRDGTSVVGPSTTVHYDDTRYAWKTVTGAFVTVHWVDGGQAFGLRALQIGDDAVRSVSTLLGVTERNPIDFYVYSDQTAFYEVLGPATRENVGGEAHPDIRTLFANIAPSALNDPWVGTVIPHELTHLVFDSAVQNAYHYPPRWLNEGIAVYLSQGYDSSDRGAVVAAVGARSLMPLGALVAQFPTTQDRFSLAYSESVAAVSFLVDRYGRDAMVKLVRSYAGGVSDDDAFKVALGVNVAAFEAAWLNSIGAPTPSPYGPQPAPAGPVPADWGGPATTPGSAAASSPLATQNPGGAGASGASSTLASLLIGFVVAVAIVGVLAFWARRRSLQRQAALSRGSSPEVAPEGAAQPGPDGMADGAPDR